MTTFTVLYKSGLKAKIRTRDWNAAIILGEAWAVKRGMDTKIINIIGHFDTGNVRISSISYDIGYEVEGDPILTTKS